MPPASALVIGAGFSGLSAATTLRDAGVPRVTVLEAGPAPGGRARTASLRALGGAAWPDAAVELGATWLHGTVGHPALEAAVQAGLVDSARSVVRAARGQFGRSAFHTPTGRGPLTGPSKRRVKSGVQAYAAAVEAAATTRAPPTASVGDATAALAADADPLAAAGARWRELLQRAMDGCDSSADLSAAGLGAYIDLPGGCHAPLPCGFGAVADAVAAGLGDSIVYNARVVRLEYGDAGVIAHTERGDTVAAAVAVVAIPLGVLQRGGLQFDPPLPPAHADVMQNIRPGAVAKLFTLFEGEDTSGCCPTTTKRRVEAVHLLWPAAPDDAPHVPDWARGIFSIRIGGPEFKGDTGNRVGVSWLAGDAARAAEAVPRTDLVAGVQAVLAAFPTAARSLPGRLVDVAVTTWSLDACFGGSYSYLPPTQAALNAQPTLRTPLVGADRTPRVAFAGEALSQHHIGTVHGAWFEGRRAARDVLGE